MFAAERILLLIERDVVDLKAANNILSAANMRQLARSRTSAVRVATQDSTFELTNFFKIYNENVMITLSRFQSLSVVHRKR